MNKVIYSSSAGLGIILEAQEKEEDFFMPESVKILDQEIKPGDYTDLFKMFTEPVKYCGLLKDDIKKCMVFFFGEDANLFETKKYYGCFYWISEKRIANKYKENTVRDFNWIDGKWK